MDLTCRDEFVIISLKKPKKNENEIKTSGNKIKIQSMSVDASYENRRLRFT